MLHGVLPGKEFSVFHVQTLNRLFSASWDLFSVEYVESSFLLGLLSFVALGFNRSCFMEMVCMVITFFHHALISFDLGVFISTCAILHTGPCDIWLLTRVAYRPTGGVAIAILFFFLKLNPHKRRSFQEHISDFDFVGLFLIVTGVVCLLVGLNNGTTSCKLQYSALRLTMNL